MGVLTPSFRALLEAQLFPRVHLHKFIGKNTPAFCAARDALITRWHGVVDAPPRQSSGGAYVSCSMTVQVATVEDVERLMEETLALPDLKVML